MSTSPDEQFLLSTLPPGRRQKQLAASVLALLLIGLLATIPFAQRPLPGTEILLSAYATAAVVNEVITAALLMALFSVQRSRALLVLAAGYLLSGLLAIPWVLTFPGVLAPMGLLDGGLQGTATIAAVRRIGFPLFVFAYVLMKDEDPATRFTRGSVRGAVFYSILAVVGAVCALTAFVVTDSSSLPGWMLDTRRVSHLWQYVATGAWMLCASTLIVLWIRRRSILDLWLLIVLCASLIEIVLLAYLGEGRFSVGWWAGRLFGLAAASVVLLVLLWEMTTLYARLARSVIAERRARETRLSAMEALSASIAHEVNQPLGSMVTNADAALRWLKKPAPDLDEARLALGRITDDGHRAAKVIDSVRTMFKQEARERVALDMRDLIIEVLGRCRVLAKLDRISLETVFDDQTRLVIGDPIQLQQVVQNLVTNAIEAMSSVGNRARLLRVSCARQDSGTIMVSIADSGHGFDADGRQRIFEPFFTTKPDGMGMGLVFSRSVIEAHGGRLWMTENATGGAVFHFTLPSGDDRDPPTLGQRL